MCAECDAVYVRSLCAGHRCVLVTGVFAFENAPALTARIASALYHEPNLRHLRHTPGELRNGCVVSLLDLCVCELCTENARLVEL